VLGILYASYRGADLLPQDHAMGYHLRVAAGHEGSYLHYEKEQLAGGEGIGRYAHSYSCDSAGYFCHGVDLEKLYKSDDELLDTEHFYNAEEIAFRINKGQSESPKGSRSSISS
jgi:hypothetical protein